MSDDNINFDSFIGGLIKTDIFRMPLKIKKKDSLVDAVLSPYLLPVMMGGINPQANIIVDGAAENRDIGIKFMGKKYHFKKDSFFLEEGEMKTSFGLYLPLTISRYSCLIQKEKPTLLHVLGIDNQGEKKDPLFFLFFNSGEDNGALGFSYGRGGISTFLGRPIGGESGTGTGLVYFFDKWAKSMFEDPIRISSSNLEEKISTVNIIPKKRNAKKKDEECPPEEKKEKINWKEPKEVIKYLDKYVIGQDEAKKKIAIALKKYRTRIETKDESIEKGNLLLIGPTGTGKTYMMSLLAKGQDIPFVDVKVTGKSVTGYVGENLTSSVFDQLIAKVKMKKNEDVCEPAGIIFLDEFDKLRANSSGENHMITELQQEIVGWTENANINLDKYGHKGPNVISTKNLLFVGAGAFSKVEGKNDSIYELVKKRIEPKKAEIGFGSVEKLSEEKKYNDAELRAILNEEDLEKFGMMPELIGRFPERAVLAPLSIEELAMIFYKVDNSIYHSYKKIIEHDGYNLEMDEKVPLMVAEKCSKETGARAIKTVAAEIFNEILFEPSKFSEKNKIIKITPALVDDFLCKTRR